MVKIDNFLKEKKLKSRMIMQIHDELIFDVPKEEADEVSTAIKDIVEKSLKLDVPIKVNIKQGINWGQMQEVK